MKSAWEEGCFDKVGAFSRGLASHDAHTLPSLSIQRAGRCLLMLPHLRIHSCTVLRPVGLYVRDHEFIDVLGIPWSPHSADQDLM